MIFIITEILRETSELAAVAQGVEEHGEGGRGRVPVQGAALRVLRILLHTHTLPPSWTLSSAASVTCCSTFTAKLGMGCS